MMYIISKVLVTALTLMLAAYLVPGVSVENVYAALVAALVIGLLNITVKPILFILTLPVTILTLGLFAFVLNALMLLVASKLVTGFTLDGFLPALVCALILAVVHGISSKLLG